MTSGRPTQLATALAVSALAAAGLAGCGGKAKAADKPTATTTPTASPTSKWTPDQQAVIDADVRFNTVVDTFSRGKALDMTQIRTVAAEPYATKIGKEVDAAVSAGFLMVGPSALRSTDAVDVAGATATLVQCRDSTNNKLVNKTVNPPQTAANPPPKVQTTTLKRVGSHWLVTGEKDGKPCTPEASDQ